MMRGPSTASTATLTMLPRIVTEGGAVVFDYSPRQQAGYVFSEAHLYYDAPYFTTTTAGADQNGWFRDQYMSRPSSYEQRAADTLARHVEETIKRDLWRK